MFSMIMEGVELGIFVWLLTLLWLDLTQSVPPTTYCSINISQPFDERFSFISCSLLKQYAHLLLVTIQSWNVLCLEFCLFYQFHLDLLSTSSRPYSDHETYWTESDGRIRVWCLGRSGTQKLDMQLSIWAIFSLHASVSCLLRFFLNKTMLMESPKSSTCVLLWSVTFPRGKFTVIYSKFKISQSYFARSNVSKGIEIKLLAEPIFHLNYCIMLNIDNMTVCNTCRAYCETFCWNTNIFWKHSKHKLLYFGCALKIMCYDLYSISVNKIIVWDLILVKLSLILFFFFRIQHIQYRNGFQWKITHMLCFSPYFLAECMMHHRGRNSTWLIFVIVQIYERLRLVSSRRAFLLHIYTKQVSFTVHSIKGLK